MLTASAPLQTDAPLGSAMPAHREALKYRYYQSIVAEVMSRGFLSC
jgi:hypothetical protein